MAETGTSLWYPGLSYCVGGTLVWKMIFCSICQEHLKSLQPQETGGKNYFFSFLYHIFVFVNFLVLYTQSLSYSFPVLLSELMPQVS